MRQGPFGSPIRAIGQVIKDCRSQFFLSLGLSAVRRSDPQVNSNLSFLSADSGPFRRSGDPFSHPSGSSVAESLLLFIRSLPGKRSDDDRCPTPNPVLRDPENVQCRSVFIQFPKSSGSQPQCGCVQPVFDSRHGRIADKIFPSQPFFAEERGRLQSVLRALCPTRLPGWRPHSKLWFFDLHLLGLFCFGCRQLRKDPRRIVVGILCH